MLLHGKKDKKTRFSVLHLEIPAVKTLKIAQHPYPNLNAWEALPSHKQQLKPGHCSPRYMHP